MFLFNKKSIFRISAFAKIPECITLLLTMCYLCSFLYNIQSGKMHVITKHPHLSENNFNF